MISHLPNPVELQVEKINIYISTHRDGNSFYEQHFWERTKVFVNDDERLWSFREIKKTLCFLLKNDLIERTILQNYRSVRIIFLTIEIKINEMINERWKNEMKKRQRPRLSTQRDDERWV